MKLANKNFYRFICVRFVLFIRFSVDFIVIHNTSTKMKGKISRNRSRRLPFHTYISNKQNLQLYIQSTRKTIKNYFISHLPFLTSTYHFSPGNYKTNKLSLSAKPFPLFFPLFVFLLKERGKKELFLTIR